MSLMIYLAGIPAAMIAIIVWSNRFPQGDLADIWTNKVQDGFARFFIVVSLLMWPMTFIIMGSQLIALALFKILNIIERVWENANYKDV
jgi:hypothetical protein